MKHWRIIIYIWYLVYLVHLINHCEKVYERPGKNLSRSINNSGEVLINWSLEVSERLVCQLIIFNTSYYITL